MYPYLGRLGLDIQYYLPKFTQKLKANHKIRCQCEFMFFIDQIHKTTPLPSKIFKPMSSGHKIV